MKEIFMIKAPKASRLNPINGYDKVVIQYQI